MTDSVHNTSRVRFTLDFIEILDSLDLDTYGEFHFEFNVYSDRRGLLRKSRLPENGTLSISEHPAMNRIGHLDHLLWEGKVEPGELIILEAQGEDRDRLSRNDPVQNYRREFHGNPDSWTGRYGPWDEGTEEVRDPENLEQWRLGYTIEAKPDDLTQPAGAPAPARDSPEPES